MSETKTLSLEDFIGNWFLSKIVIDGGNGEFTETFGYDEDDDAEPSLFLTINENGMLEAKNDMGSSMSSIIIKEGRITLRIPSNVFEGKATINDDDSFTLTDIKSQKADQDNIKIIEMTFSKTFVSEDITYKAVVWSETPKELDQKFKSGVNQKGLNKGLIKAIADAYPWKVYLVLKYGGDPNYVSDDGLSPLIASLIYASDEKKDDILKMIALLLSKGADVNSKYNGGMVEEWKGKSFIEIIENIELPESCFSTKRVPEHVNHFTETIKNYVHNNITWEDASKPFIDIENQDYVDNDDDGNNDDENNNDENNNDENNDDEYNEKNEDEYFNNLYKKKIEQLSEIIKKDPKNVDALIYRAILKKLNGDNSFIEDYNLIISEQPNSYAYLNKAYFYKNFGNLEQAMKDFTKCIELKYESIEPYEARGLIYIDSGRFEDAIEDFNKAISLDSDEYSPYFNRGFAKTYLGRFEEAILDFEKVFIFSRGKHESASYYASLLHYRLGNYDEALNIIDHSIPKYTLDAIKAIIRLVQKDISKATSLFISAYSNIYDPICMLAVALKVKYIDKSELDFEKQLEAIDKFYSLNSSLQKEKILVEYQQTYFDLGITAQRLGDYQTAITCLKKCISLGTFSYAKNVLDNILKITSPKQKISTKTTIPTKTTSPVKTTTPTKTTTPVKTIIPTKTTTTTNIPTKTTVPTKTTSSGKTIIPTKTTSPVKTTLPTKTTSLVKTTLPTIPTKTNSTSSVNTVEEGNRPRFKTQSKADIKSLTSKFESISKNNS